MKLIAELDISVKYRFEREFKNNDEFMEYVKLNGLLNKTKDGKFELDEDELISMIPDYGDEIGQDVNDFFAMLVEGDDEYHNDEILASCVEEISGYMNDIPVSVIKDTETLDMFNEDGEVISREE